MGNVSLCYRPIRSVPVGPMLPSVHTAAHVGPMLLELGAVVYWTERDATGKRFQGQSCQGAKCSENGYALKFNGIRTLAESNCKDVCSSLAVCASLTFFQQSGVTYCFFHSHMDNTPTTMENTHGWTLAAALDTTTGSCYYRRKKPTSSVGAGKGCRLPALPTNKESGLVIAEWGSACGTDAVYVKPGSYCKARCKNGWTGAEV